MAVVPVASCQRAMPSLSTPLRKAASTTTHSSASPCLAPPSWPTRCRRRRSRPRPRAGPGRSPRAPTPAAAPVGERSRGDASRADDTMAAPHGEPDRCRGRRPHARLYGVRHLFGLCGDTSLPFYDALYRLEHGITHVLTRDERSAAYMADGYARVSGRPGVCEGPSGGGATYLLPGLVEANESCSPCSASPPTCRYSRAAATRSPSSIRNRCFGRLPNGIPCATAPNRFHRRFAPPSAR